MSIHLDFETFSKVDLPSVGAFRYAEDASTEALIASFSLDGKGPVVGVDLTRPESIRQMEPLFNAVDRGAKVCAHNSQFERLIWEKVLTRWPIVPRADQWDCTSARASALSIPASLELAAMALGLKVHKDMAGKGLIKKFSIPQKDGSRIRATDDPQAFQEFIKYCKQDTVVERELDKVLPHLHPDEQKIFALDFKVNDQGIPIDIPLVKTAIEFVQLASKGLERQALKLTGIKTSQRDKLLEWLGANGTPMDTLQAVEVEAVIANPNTPRRIRRLLETRIELSRAGAKKLKTMLACASLDGRIRGGFWYHSASTGRWGASRVQFHNLSKPDDDYPQEDVLDLLRKGNLDLFYDRPLTAISKAIRGFIKAPDNERFLIADYAAIEARGLAWLAGEEFMLELYRNGRDVYKEIASKIFGVPYALVSDSQRFFGKQTVLGAGYGMGADKFVLTCAKFGVTITKDQAKKVIDAYRASVPKIVKFWKTVETAAIRTVLTGKPTSVSGGKLNFIMDTLPNGFKVLFVVLPSGRRMAYPEPRVENIEKWGQLRPTLIFKTMYRSMWVDEETYGGKMVENINQGMCRDQLADGMVFVDHEGLPIVLHIHDEIGAQVPVGSYKVHDFETLVCKARDWAKTIPVKAEGKILQRYAK